MRNIYDWDWEWLTEFSANRNFVTVSLESDMSQDQSNHYVCDALHADIRRDTIPLIEYIWEEVLLQNQLIDLI